MDDIISKLEKEKNEVEILQEEVGEAPQRIPEKKRKKRKGENDIDSIQELLSVIDSKDVNVKKKRVSVELEHKDQIVLSLIGVTPKELIRLLLDDFCEQPQIKKFIHQSLKFKK